MNDDNIDEPLLNGSDNPLRRKERRNVEKQLWLAIILLLLANTVLVLRLVRVPIAETTKFARLSYNTPTTYHNWTNFQDPELRDQSWHDLDITPLEITLSDAEAEQLRLDKSVFRFPWAQDRGIYFVKAFHDLHCLKAIRYALENPEEDEIEHVYHCLDALRQDIMCNADDTPMAVHDLPNKMGNGQIRMCRDFEALVRWTKSPDIFPCYSREADNNPNSAVEAYAFCDESSPYFAVQKAYFARWGDIG